jgi:hypothetical protein
MRVSARSLGSLGDYQGPSPVTLIDGTVISDPGSTPATQAQCDPYICGADAENLGARIWCAFWGRAGNAPCRPVCAQWDSEGASTCEIAITGAAAPPPTSAVQNAQVNQPVAQAMPPTAPATLTPATIVAPMPSITAALAPEPAQTCSDWQSVNGWIADNPLFAAAIAVGAFAIIYHCQTVRVR